MRVTKRIAELRDLDLVEPPDLRTEIHRRSEDIGPPYPIVPESRRTRLITGVLVVLILGASLLFLGRAFLGTEPPRPGATGSQLIAFAATQRDGSGPFVSVSAADGSGRRRLGPGWAPSWSPDGKQIVFQRANGDGDSTSIFLMNADGSDVRRLTADHGGYDEDPEWSPDGRLIVFTRGLPGGQTRDLYVIAPDGSGLRRLTPRRSDDFGASWSPDASQLALVRVPDGSLEGSQSRGPNQIWILDLETSRLRQMTEVPKGAYRPSWSPDGSSIAFEDGAGVIMILSLSDQSVAKLPIHGYGVDWSPESDQLLITRTRGEGDLAIISLTGNVLQIIGGPGRQAEGSWIAA